MQSHALQPVADVREVSGVVPPSQSGQWGSVAVWPSSCSSRPARRTWSRVWHVGEELEGEHEVGIV